MSPQEYGLVLAVMKSRHKHKHGKDSTCKHCEEQMHEVIDALRIAGFAIIQMGTVRALKKAIGGIHQ